MKTLITLFFILFSFIPPSNLNEIFKTRLQSGWYVVSKTPGTQFELNDTKQYFDLDPNTIITVKNIINTTVGMSRKVNEHSLPTLTITFDSNGARIMNKALHESTPLNGKLKIGFILNDKLRLVTDVAGPINGPSISILSPQSSLEQLNALKLEIDNSH